MPDLPGTQLFLDQLQALKVSTEARRRRTVRVEDFLALVDATIKLVNAADKSASYAGRLEQRVSILTRQFSEVRSAQPKTAKKKQPDGFAGWYD